MTDEMNRLVGKGASALNAAGAKEVHALGSGSMNPPNDDLIGDIVRRIVETAQPEKIILFGSRARGDARPNSDFDVLVIKESSEPGYRRDAPLYVALADLPVEVEVLVYTPEEVAEWAQVPQAFVTTATREGKTVYERKS
jgi:predicted nucleotidyltransferase